MVANAGKSPNKRREDRSREVMKKIENSKDGIRNEEFKFKTKRKKGNLYRRSEVEIFGRLMTKDGLDNFTFTASIKGQKDR